MKNRTCSELQIPHYDALPLSHYSYDRFKFYDAKFLEIHTSASLFHSKLHFPYITLLLNRRKSTDSCTDT